VLGTTYRVEAVIHIWSQNMLEAIKHGDGAARQEYGVQSIRFCQAMMVFAIQVLVRDHRIDRVQGS
jgi:hypothetical protein